LQETSNVLVSKRIISMSIMHAFADSGQSITLAKSLAYGGLALSARERSSSSA